MGQGEGVVSNEGPRGQPFTGHAFPVLAPRAPEEGFGDVMERLRALEFYAHRVSVWADQLVSLLEHRGIDARSIGAEQVRGDNLRSGEIGWPKLSTIKLAEVRVTPDPGVYDMTFARIENDLATSGDMSQDLVVYGIRRAGRIQVELGRDTMQPAPLARIGAASFLPPVRPIIQVEDGKTDGGLAQKRYSVHHPRDLSQTQSDAAGLPSRDGL